MLKIDTILCPTDFSESAQAAFSLAQSLARDHGARIVALHALPVPLMTAHPALSQDAGDIRESILEQLQAEYPPTGDVPLDYQVVEGNPPDEILEAASDLGCDLIVMGTHGRSGLRRLFMGSVAEKVLREADCPVITVRTPRKEAEATSGEETANV